MLRLLSLALSCSVVLSLYGHVASAVSSDLVISHVQTGGSGSGTAGQEFIAVYNNSDSEVNITNWCVTYSDYTNATIVDLYCFNAAEEMDEVRVSAKSSIVVASPSYPGSAGVVTGTYINSSTTLSGTRGHVAIYNEDNQVVDRVAWDNKASAPPASPETIAAVAPAGGSMLLRDFEETVFVDTDHNLNDFSVVTSLLPAVHPLIDYVAPPELVDVCENLPNIQSIMPSGYDYEDTDNCELISADLCQNVNNVQLMIPQNMSGLNGSCYDTALDACTNIENFQLDIPNGFREISSDLCKVINPKGNIVLSEILANSAGTDAGHEFIEIYNSDQRSIDLSDYSLAIGKNAEKILSLPAHDIAPGEYVYFSDTDLVYTLLNTTTQVKLLFYDGTVVDEIIPYQDPGDDVSWSLIDDVWQFTDIVTPGSSNIAMSQILGDNDVQSTAGLAPCPAGKYRNTLTNRCRNIEEDASVLASCAADEYRNPETNRCKKIALAAGELVPCAEGYERNEDTNRCRKLQEDAQLVPCAEGYERNPETNRCRKTLSTTQTADATNSSEPVPEESIISSPYALAATVGTGAVGYGIYEWRTELGAAIRRILSAITKK
jgi:hypothetical protein